MSALLDSDDQFDLSAPLPRGWLLLEASAGTGKTYSLTALVARSIIEDELRTEQLLMVTFTRAAAAELSEETRAQLRLALAAFSQQLTDDLIPDWLRPLLQCSDSERKDRRQRLEVAVSTIESATITTIHGFFQSALRELGLRAGLLASAEVATEKSDLSDRMLRDRMLTLLSGSTDALGVPDKDPVSLERVVRSVLSELDTNLAAGAAPAGPPDGSPESVWATLVGSIREEVRTVRRSSGRINFDDLITGVVELIEDPSVGPSIITALRERYRLVLIDEFQDTDALQWSLFSRCFQPSTDPDDPFLALIVVGDPKQAIYRFRGADISAYLAAASDPRMICRRMTRNWRSDRVLVDSLNGLLMETEFGDPDIPYVPVDTPPRDPDPRMLGGGAPLQLRWVPKHPELTSEKGVLLAPKARAHIAEDLTDHVVQLLTGGQILDGEGGSGRPVAPGDICILVRGHTEVDLLIEALSARGLPAVRSRVGSVLDSEAAGHLRLLFTALARVGDTRRVDALALSWFVSDPIDAVLDHSFVEELQRRSAQWAAELESDGVASFFQRLRTDPEVVLSIAASTDVERALTDLEHIVELLHVRSAGRALPASTVLQLLDELIAARSDTDAEMRRIDSDARAIQITTIHASKGLEYPIVLLPFPKGANAEDPAVFTADGARYVDAAPLIDWTRDGLTPAARAELSRREVRADELRILYVALTRARHQLVVWWAHTKGVADSPLARILFGDTSDLDSIPVVPSDDDMSDHLDRLAARVGAGLEVREIPAGLAMTPMPSAPAPPVDSFDVAIYPDRPVALRSWYRWSYSKLTEGRPGENEDRARGGHDEPDVPSGGVGNGDPAASSAPLHGELLQLPSSAAFGVYVHEILERVDFTAEPLVETIASAAGNVFYADFTRLDHQALASGLAAALATPLDADPESLRLVDVPILDRLTELEFHFALRDGSAAVRVADIFRGAVADPIFGEYFARLARSAGSFDIRGLMTGSIDAVLRIPTPSGSTFSVIDYKTNRLHQPDRPVLESDYAMPVLHRAMEHGDYPVQILFYNVALHRLLSMRLADYDIDRHIVASRYLFLRGMVGAATPVVDGTRTGVFAWRPSSELILRTSDLLRGDT